MTTPFLAADLKRDEGCVLRAYQDRGGVWTIGVGHTGQYVRAGLIWSQATADRFLDEDIATSEAELGRELPWWRNLNDPRQDVLVSMVFNLGMEGVMAFHHTLGAIEHAQYPQAAADMLLCQPWHSQIGHRCDRLAAQMRTGVRGDPAQFQSAAA